MSVGWNPYFDNSQKTVVSSICLVVPNTFIRF
jgi:hypothetical protein